MIDLHNYNKLSNAIDKLIQNTDQTSEFALVCITIKSTIRKPSNSDFKEAKSTVKGINIENYI